MYINFELLFNKNIHSAELLCLQAIHQQKSEELEEVIKLLICDDYLKRFKEEGLVTVVKGKSSESELKKLRTTPKGRDLLLSLQKKQEWDEDDEKVIEWLLSVYNKKPNYVKGNNTEAKRRTHWFKMETGIVKNYLTKLIYCFINDSFVDDPKDKRGFSIKFSEFKQENPRAVLSNKIENIFWTPKDNFARYYDLEYSPLWKYYNENKEYINKKWEDV